MLKASCHCGAVTLEIPSKTKKLAECNCSICWRYGVRWAYYPNGAVTIRAAPGVIRQYCWGEKESWFKFCGECGCVINHEPIDETSNGPMAINARLMEPKEIHGLPIVKIDGASSFQVVEDWPEP